MSRRVICRTPVFSEVFHTQNPNLALQVRDVVTSLSAFRCILHFMTITTFRRTCYNTLLSLAVTSPARHTLTTISSLPHVPPIKTRTMSSRSTITDPTDIPTLSDLWTSHELHRDPETEVEHYDALNKRVSIWRGQSSLASYRAECLITR
jgi:hypothetical protein